MVCIHALYLGDPKANSYKYHGYFGADVGNDMESNPKRFAFFKRANR